jgi:putative peptidoglycan lipid II flippase
MLLRGTAIVSLLTLVSRFLGFIRDLLVANLLGASLFADAFFVAFRIPNLLRSFAAEGALTSAFVPVFSTALFRGKEEAREALRRITSFVLILTTSLTIVGIAYAPEVVSLIAPGFSEDPSKRALAADLTKIMMPYIICVSLIAMLNSALNTLKIFGASGIAQVLMNLTLIAGAFAAMPFEPQQATIILAVSVLVGGIIQVVAQVPACRRAGLTLKPSRKVLSPEVRELTRLMLPATIGASVYQLTIFIATLLASTRVEGSISWLFYADRVAQFPIGIFSIALASVLLPTLANASAASDTERFNGVLADSLRFTSFFIIPMSAGIWALAEPITALLFERGAFTHNSTLMTASAIQALAFGLWATSCYSMIVRAFIARKDTITPTVIGIASIAVYLVCALVLMGPLLPSESSRLITSLSNAQRILSTMIPVSLELGHKGLALASSLAALASLTFAIGVFSVRIGAFPWKSFLRSMLQSLIASVVMVIALRETLAVFAVPLTACLLGIPVGMIVYALAARIVSSQELSESFAVIKRVAKSRLAKR